MKDDLFDYLVATDKLDDFLGKYDNYKIKQKCPNCNKNTLIPIIYGMPSSEIFELYEKGIVHLGGCVISENEEEPNAYCTSCDQEFII